MPSKAQQIFDQSNTNLRSLDTVRTATTASLAGGPGDDVLYGTEGNDLLEGLGGNDTLYGLGGNDILSGGEGDDVLFGGAGNDWLDGGAGNDSLRGDSGADTYVFGRGYGSDTIRDVDAATGIVDAVEFTADVAPEDIYLSRTGYNLFADIGDTSDSLKVTFQFWESSRSQIRYFEIEEFRFEDGTVWNNEMIEAITAVGTGSDDEITGTIYNDSLKGLGGDDIVDGGTGNDTIRGGFGDDTLSGGDGTDTLLGDADEDTLSGGAGADMLDGGNSADSLFGDSGDDTLVGGAGNDLMVGGAGDDALSGGDDADVYRFEGVFDNDTIFDYQAGIDTVEFIGYAASDVALSNDGVDTLVDLGVAGSVVLSGAIVESTDQFVFI